METEAKIGDEVVILTTAWVEDSPFYTGVMGVLLSIETKNAWATVRPCDMLEGGFVAVTHYVKLTPLTRTLV
jgi:hypothetical protein